MNQVTFCNYFVLIIVSGFVTLATASDDNNVPTSQAPSSEGQAHSTVAIAGTETVQVNVSKITSALSNTSLQTEHTGATVQKTVSFSSPISNDLGESDNTSSSSAQYETYDASESKSSIASKEDFSTMLHRNASFVPEEEVEKGFVEHFDTSFSEDERSTFWKTMRIVYLHSGEEMRKICQSIYRSRKRSTEPPIVTPQTLSYRLRIAVLNVGPDGTRNFWIDVLKCTLEGMEIVHATKGRRPNSVYFVEPALTCDSEDDFLLDINFDSDVDLDYDFTSVAESILEKNSNRRTTTGDSEEEDSVLDGNFENDIGLDYDISSSAELTLEKLSNGLSVDSSSQETAECDNFEVPEKSMPLTKEQQALGTSDKISGSSG